MYGKILLFILFVKNKTQLFQYPVQSWQKIISSKNTIMKRRKNCSQAVMGFEPTVWNSVGMHPGKD